MKLSTRSRYGTRMLLDIAMNGQESPVRIKDISQRQGVSIKYLEKLIRPLKRAQFIKSKRGPKGGHMLNMAPEKITIGQLVRLFEDELSLTRCVKDPSTCPITEGLLHPARVARGQSGHVQQAGLHHPHRPDGGRQALGQERRRMLPRARRNVAVSKHHIHQNGGGMFTSLPHSCFKAAPPQNTMTPLLRHHAGSLETVTLPGREAGEKPVAKGSPRRCVCCYADFVRLTR